MCKLHKSVIGSDSEAIFVINSRLLRRYSSQ